jgi:hypothetical protein
MFLSREDEHQQPSKGKIEERPYRKQMTIAEVNFTGDADGEVADGEAD